MKTYKATIWYSIQETIEVQAASSYEADELIRDYVDQNCPHNAVDSDWTFDVEDNEIN